MKDQELLQSIVEGGLKREQALQYFYNKNIYLIRRMRRKYKTLSEDDIWDAYSDAILNFRENILKEAFKGQSKCSTYLHTIMQRRCSDIKKFQQTFKETLRREQKEITVLESFLENKEKSIIDKLSIKMKVETLKILAISLGAACQKILWDACFEGYSMAEIADRNGIASTQAARQKKYNCLQRLLKKVDNLGLSFS